ncbi:MAG: AlpA family transcriptional regulator [Sphingomonadaceae bacterium]|nr:AlpA family transcriptional regulator [Sphingomonadaceae bacterium]
MQNMTTLLRLPEVLARTNLSRSKLYELLDAGQFPKPCKAGERVNTWADTEIEEWIQTRLADR